MAQIRYEFLFDDKGVVQGVTKINEGLDKSGTSAEKAAKSVEAASGTMSSALGTVKTIAAGIGLSFGVLEVARIFKTAIVDALEFQDKMANVNSILGDSSVTSQQLGGQLLQLSGSLGSASELADAMYEAIGAGVPAAQSIQFVTEATKLAQATLADTGETTKLLATVMNAYGLKISEVSHISDVFTETVASGIVKGEELAHELGTVIPTAALLGVSIEEVSAAVATMTRTGINASESTTALNQALLSFLKPSKEAAKIAEELGIDLSANAIHTKGFAGALADLKDKVGSNDEALIAMFGSVRGGRAALALTGEQAGFFTELIVKMQTQVGKTDEAFQKQNDTINRQLTIAYNTLGHAVTAFLNDTSDAVSVSDVFTFALKKMNAELEFQIKLINEFGAFVGGNLTQAYNFATGKTGDLDKAIGDMAKRMTDAAHQSILGAKNIEEFSEAERKAKEAAEKFAKEVESLTDNLRPNSHEVDVLNAALKRLDAQGVSSSEIVKKFGDKTIEARSAMIEMGHAVPQMVDQVALQAALKKASEAQAKFNKDVLEDFKKSQDQQADYANKTLDKILKDRQEGSAKFAEAWNKAMTSQIKAGEDAEAALRAASDETLRHGEANMRDETKFRNDEINLQLKTIDERGKQEQKSAEQAQRVWEEAAGNITTGMAKAFTDVIFHGGNFKDSMVDLATSTAESMLQAFIAGLIAPLITKFTGLGASLASEIPGLGGAAAGAGGIGAGAGAGSGGLGIGPGAAAVLGPAAIAGAGALLVTQIFKDSPFGDLWGALNVMLTQSKRMEAVVAAGIDLDSLALQNQNLGAESVLQLAEQLVKLSGTQASAANSDPRDQGFWDYFYKDMPTYAVGTPYVERTGPAIVHRGEAIIPANQNRGGGITLNVNVQGDVYAPTDFYDRVEIAVLRGLGMNGEFRTKMRKQVGASAY